MLKALDRIEDKGSKPPPKNPQWIHQTATVVPKPWESRLNPQNKKASDQDLQRVPPEQRDWVYNSKT